MRRLLILLLAILCSPTPSSAKEIKILDKRVHSEPVEYAVSIAAEGGELGHSFVIWNRGDPKQKMTIQQVIGFYPQSDKSKLKAVFGLSPGQFFDDASEKPDIVLIVLINQQAYERARSVFEKWKAGGNYLLGFSDCTTFVAEIGASIGLKLPGRLLAPYPIDFVKATVTAN